MVRPATSAYSGESAAVSSTNSRVSALTLVTSDIRFMKRKAAATSPTSTATVRSTSTVRKKVSRSTMTSLFGARSSEANVRQSAMW